MRDSTLRWGLGMGLVGAALGIVTLVLGAFFLPIPSYSTAEAVAAAILIRGILALVALGITLGLAYYAGLRVEQDRVRGDGVSASGTGASFQERSGSLIAGLLVAFCWWFGTTLTGYLLPLLPQTASSAASLSDFEQRLIWGVLVTIIGTGLGGLGSRTIVAGKLLDRIVVSPTATTVPLASTAAYSAPAHADGEPVETPVHAAHGNSATDAPPTDGLSSTQPTLSEGTSRSS
jgi:hypothetical protein